MNEKLLQSAENSVINTFSEMVFIDVEQANEKENEVKYSSILYIPFFKPENGAIALFLPTKLKKIIAENIHGEDYKSLNKEETDDSLLELLNVIAGSFLCEYFGTAESHLFSFPRIFFDNSELDIYKSNTSFYFDAEGVLFKLTIFFKEVFNE